VVLWTIEDGAGRFTTSERRARLVNRTRVKHASLGLNLVHSVLDSLRDDDESLDRRTASLAETHAMFGQALEILLEEFRHLEDLDDLHHAQALLVFIRETQGRLLERERDCETRLRERALRHERKILH
jgi:hypothetical protein